MRRTDAAAPGECITEADGLRERRERRDSGDCRVEGHSRPMAAEGAEAAQTGAQWRREQAHMAQRQRLAACALAAYCIPDGRWPMLSPEA
eukprot:4779099-Prymnesium_polylepis.1